MRRLILLAVLVACGGGSSMQGPGDGSAKMGSDGSGMPPKLEPDASPTLPVLFRFAVVGDTRPANEDDVGGYPTTVITKIWADVQATNPHPDFAISTGDYMFANPFVSQASSTVDKQLDLYLGARAQFTNAEFAAMGNHECTGATASNCGAGATDGITFNMGEFMKRLLNPLGITQPYYVIHFAASDNSWTAKLVFIAANAWNSTQSAWLSQTLAEATTYTFAIRHESSTTSGPPGVAPSEQILAQHPLTLRIVGHTHTYSHYASNHEVISGNGGAPLTSSSNYGYMIVERLSNGDIQVSEHDYQSNAVTDQWRIHADGTAAP
jgi:hypothetical protein